MKKELNQKQYGFPNEAEIERVVQRMTQPGYRRINQGLMPNATTEEKIKHNLCQNITRYARENKLTEKQISERLEIDQVKTEYILFDHIAEFDLENLVYLTEKLAIKIIEPNKSFLSIAPHFYASRSS